MDTIIWLDGHTSKISSKEANSKSYNIITRGRCEFRLSSYLYLEVINITAK